MRVLATSLAAGVISTVLFGCSEDDNESPPKTKYDADIDYNWDNDVTKTLVPTGCEADSSYADFLTHEYDDDFDIAKANEVAGCMKCLGDGIEDLDFGECGEFTSGAVIETCAPFQALKDFVKKEDSKYKNLGIVLARFDVCEESVPGNSIKVATELEIKEHSATNLVCDGRSLDSIFSVFNADSTTAQIQEAFSCMKCIADNHKPEAIEYKAECDWQSTVSIVYDPHGCGAFQTMKELVAATDTTSLKTALDLCAAARE